MSGVLENSVSTFQSDIGLKRSVLPNISINYLYRDAANYKLYREVIVSNPLRHSVEQIWIKIGAALDLEIKFFGEPFFRPEWVGLPTAFLFSLSGYSRNDDDHDWHELCSVEETADPVTQDVVQTIDDLLNELRNTHGRLIAPTT